jgi:hypothetical protein
MCPSIIEWKLAQTNKRMLVKFMIMIIRAQRRGTQAKEQRKLANFRKEGF